MMDDDVHAEGWQRDVIYPPCPNNPRRCMDCGGTGDAGPEVTTQDDCPACDGTGWAKGKAEHPVSLDDLADDIYARMHRAAEAGRGVRLTSDEIDLLSRTTVGQWMADAAEKVLARKKSRRSSSLTPEA